MKNLSAIIVLLAGLCVITRLETVLNARADDNSATTKSQIINDEGYGNADEEYYNSENAEPSVPQENSSQPLQ